MSCSVKCGGKCCARFIIHATPERIRERYDTERARRDAGQEFDRDMITIAEMILALEPCEDGTPAYTCRHHDPSSGLCGIYETRPAMCSGYPGYEHGGTCNHCGYVDAPPELAQLAKAESSTA